MDINKMMSMYNDQRMNASEIARVFGVTPNTVYKRLGRAGMKFRSASEAALLRDHSECSLASSAITGEVLESMYISDEKSIPTIASELKWPRSRVRKALLSAGVTLRTVSEALSLKPDLGFHSRGIKRKPMSQQCKDKLREAALLRAEQTAKGVSLKPNGYLEHTRGPHKGRSVHVVILENHIGRRLLSGECTHHIDGDKTNNHISNLKLMTRSSHMRLHRLLDTQKRERGNDGRFS